VRIHADMGTNSLPYVAPAVAGVATADGRFSIELERLRIPLEDLAQGDFAGRMFVHSIELGPGPLIQELALAMGYNGPAQIAQNSTIDFQLANGRVYHRGVELKFPDVTVRTHGSVGIDKTLDLMAELTLPSKLRNDKTLAAALPPDQTIQLPIRGTVDHPKMDHDTLRYATRQILQSATQNLLQDQLNKQFNRLLNPSR
jgi:translocation and assembly module TamB